MNDDDRLRREEAEAKARHDREMRWRMLIDGEVFVDGDGKFVEPEQVDKE